jgi:GNAT superfamily N-acetyltransferase
MRAASLGNLRAIRANARQIMRQHHPPDARIRNAVRRRRLFRCPRRNTDKKYSRRALRGWRDRAKLLPMTDLALQIRRARLDDAADVAQVYIDSWHDTYPGVLPRALLGAMTPRGQTARWKAAIGAQTRETVLVADSCDGIIGMASLGPARDRALGFDGEVYTLYVDPAHFEIGVGRALLNGAFAALRQNGMTSCVIWAHARNPARYFYEAMGGRLIAERTTRLMGEPCPETAFGWKVLAVAERTSAR